MDNAGYTSLTRQAGLLQEMQSIANNIANISTTGFQKEGAIFAEYIHDLEGSAPSLSMAKAMVQYTDTRQGGSTQTGATFDFAIEGGGYFLIETPSGQQLTRAGSFTPSAEGELMTHDGFRLLDSGAAPVFIPPDAKSIAVSSDGTISADGRPIGQIGLFQPVNPNEITRQNGVRFLTESGVEPKEGGQILQGFLEGSNVNAVSEIARMIEVQHAYEMGQKFLEKEDERIRAVLSTLGR